MFSTYLAAFAVLIALAALLVAAQAVSYSKKCTEWMAEYNTSAAVLKRFVELEAEMTLLKDLIESLRKSMHKLRSRISMRKLNDDRNARDLTQEPDPDKDPQAWKEFWNRQHSLNFGGKEND